MLILVHVYIQYYLERTVGPLMKEFNYLIMLFETNADFHLRYGQRYWEVIYL